MMGYAKNPDPICPRLSITEYQTVSSLLRIFGLSILLLQLVGCTLSAPPTDPRLICKGLKRQYIYNRTNNNTEASFTTNGQKEALTQQMRALHCDRYH